MSSVQPQWQCLDLKGAWFYHFMPCALRGGFSWVFPLQFPPKSTSASKPDRKGKWREGGRRCPGVWWPVAFPVLLSGHGRLREPLGKGCMKLNHHQLCTETDLGCTLNTVYLITVTET